MTENKQSSVISGISNGFFRIAIVVCVVIVGVGGWLSFDQKPSFTLTYRYLKLDPIPKLVKECSKNDATFSNRWATETPKGATIHINYCFQKVFVTSSNGEMYNGVPYKKGGGDTLFVEESPSRYGYTEGEKYIGKLIDSFKPPEQDLVEADKEYWGQKFIEIGKGLLNTIGVLIGWLVFALVIRFIWRGFTNRD